jgi:aminopeptidase N
MLEQYLGQEVLRAGLKDYLGKHKFGSAVTRLQLASIVGDYMLILRDLWKALASATGGKIDVETIMNTWTLQMGYPLITLERGLNTSTGWSAAPFPSSASSSSSGVSSRRDSWPRPACRESQPWRPARSGASTTTPGLCP